MRRVRLFQRSNFIGRKPQSERRNGVRKMMRLCGADDRRSDRRFAEHPGERDLGARNAALFRDLPHAIHHPAVHFLGA